MEAPVLIVGAAAAGIATAEAMQRLAPDREVWLLGDEPTLAHDRPPLSKQVLQGSWEPSRAQLLSPLRRAQLEAKLLLGKRATALDTERQEVHVDDGTALRYSDLVIATGVRPRSLNVPHMPRGVLLLRDLEQCLALRSALLKCAASRAVIVGGGFIGLEVASTARKLGVAVTIVEPSPNLLPSRIGVQAATRLLDLHRANNVDFRFGVGVAGYVTHHGHAIGVTLSDGSVIEANVILVAIGCTPNVEWLSDSTVDISNGVLCDEYCQAAPHVWAAGDVARWLHKGLKRHIRIEHRLNASEQGMAVAGNIVGPARPYVPVPLFWTDQWNVRLQLAGVIEAGCEESVKQLGSDSYLHTFHAQDRLVAVLGWNAAKEIMPLRRQLAAEFA